MRFAHIADVHLDYPIYSKEGKVVGRRVDLWDEFDRVVDYLELNPVEYFFITGDLFDYVPSEKDLARLDNILSRLSNTSIVYITGEKDCCRDGAAIWTYKFMSNMYVLNGRPFNNCVPKGMLAKRVEERGQNVVVDHIRFDKDNLEIYGVCQYNFFNERTDFDSISVTNPNAINILLCHGGEENVSPFEPEDIQSRMFDYVGVGHKHSYTEYVDKKIYFPGSLVCLEEGARFERHGFIRGHIYKDDLKIKYIASTTEYDVYAESDTPVDEVKSIDTILAEKERLITTLKNCDAGIKNYETVRDQYTDYTGEYNRLNEEKKKIEYELNVLKHEDMWVDRKYDMAKLRTMIFAIIPSIVLLIFTTLLLSVPPKVFERRLILCFLFGVFCGYASRKLYDLTAHFRHTKYGALNPIDNHYEYSLKMELLENQVDELAFLLDEAKKKNRPIDSINYKIGEIRRSRKIAVKNLAEVETKLNRLNEKKQNEE